VRIHDLEGNLAITLLGHTQGISDVAWTQDASHVATASDDKLIKVWDVETVRYLMLHHFLSMASIGCLHAVCVLRFAGYHLPLQPLKVRSEHCYTLALAQHFLPEMWLRCIQLCSHAALHDITLSPC
jgi:WD40 repeat protein